MKIILFLLTIIKNKIKNILFLEKKGFIEDEKLKNFSGTDDRWIQDDGSELKLVLKLMLEHNYKYELLKILQNNQISILDKMHYVSQYNAYHNTFLCNTSLMPNLLSGGLKKEFDDFF